jgi:hypothetical protein
MVVNLTIEGQNISAAGRQHRLVASWRKVNDGEASKSKGNGLVSRDPDSRVIRPAMSDALGHSGGQYGCTFGALTR